MEENKYKKVEDIIVKRRKFSSNKSITGYRGVSKDTSTGNRFTAHFSFASNKTNNIKLHLGTYNTPEEAYIARLKFIDSLK